MSNKAPGAEESLYPVDAPLRVLKRGGNATQEFNLSKIERAIEAAFQESGQPLDSGFHNKLAKLVKAKLLLRYKENEVIPVETIQDFVETALMESGRTEVAKAYIIYRNKHQGLRENRLVPDPLAVANYIHPGKYARYLPEQKRREVYEETVARVEAMHVRRFPDLKEEINEAFDLVRQKKLLPSMRAMQFAGPAVEAVHVRQYNCSFLHVDKVRSFSDAFYLLLCGCGVGYSVQFDHVEKLPVLKHVNPRVVKHHTVADSIEGWANSVLFLINSYVRGFTAEFNYSRIRAEGELLKTSGGKAPGHLGLKSALDLIREILETAQGRQLRPIECYDIMCHIADAVLSGGIRRSATICLFSFEDGEMMAAKTGKWLSTHPWRANANNSVILKRDDVTKKQFKRIFKYIKEFGEPGFAFVENYDHGGNPCQPAWAPIITQKGLRTLGDVCVGDKIWSKEGWTVVTKKWSTGVKDVNRYRTTAGVFYGTENHQIVSQGEKVEVKDAETIDVLRGPDVPYVEWDPQTVLDGVFYGDGYFHATGEHTYSVLCIGKNDQDYFDSEIAPLIGSTHGTDFAFVVSTTVSPQEYRTTLEKKIPTRFLTNSTSICSFLRGLYSANGSFVGGARVTLKSISKNLIEQVQILLSTVGISSYFTTNKSKDVTFYNGTYTCKESYDLNITTDRGKFFKLIGFIQPYKMIALEKSLSSIGRPHKTSYEIRDVEYVSTEEVFDITVDNSSHTYWTGGVDVSNCFEIGLNPVLEITEEVLEMAERKRDEGQHIPKLKLGETYTGCSFCNLGEINAAAFKTEEDFYYAAKMSARIGTLQAAYTSFPYLGWVSELIAEREALLGVSMTGMLDSPDISLNPAYQRNAAEIAVSENKRMSKLLGIRSAARVTCVKPSGTTSLELGCVGSGIHPHHARRYIRRVTANELEPVFQYFRKINPHMCQKKPDGDWVIEFPVEAPTGATVNEDLKAIPFLEMVRSTQQNWVVPGTSNPNSSPGLRHNVSNTVVVDTHEWDDVSEYVWKYKEDFSGISFLPKTGDKDYAFSPREAITTEADEDKWNQLLRHYTLVDYTKMVEEDDSTALKGEVACAGGACEV